MSRDSQVVVEMLVRFLRLNVAERESARAVDIGVEVGVMRQTSGVEEWWPFGLLSTALETMTEVLGSGPS